MIRFAAIALLAGCSNLLGIEDLRGGDGGGVIDDTPAPTVLEIAGTITTSGMDGESYAFMPVELVLRNSGVRQQTSTDATSSFRFEVAREDNAIDALIIVRGEADTAPTFNYLPPLTRDISFQGKVFDDQLIKQLAANAGQPEGPSFVMLFASSQGGIPRRDVVFQSSSDSPIIYAGELGQPDPTVNRTTGSGLAFQFSQPPITVQYTASNSDEVTEPREIELAVDGQQGNAFVVFELP